MNKTNLPDSPKAEWEDRFDEFWFNKDHLKQKYNADDIKAFITSEREKAKAEERKRIKQMINSPRKYTWVYIEGRELINEITNDLDQLSTPIQDEGKEGK